MLTFVQGEAVTITVPLLRDGEPFVADTDTTRWSLRDHSGALMSGYIDQTPTDDTNVYIPVTIPDAANLIDPARLFEKRFVLVVGLVDGEPFQASVTYRLAPWLNHTVTPDAVRAFIGTDNGELPDAEVDLTSAYFELATQVTTPFLAAALASGTQMERIANDAIKGLAVLAVLPGLRQRLLKRAEDGVLKAERFAIDWDRLTLDAQRLVGRALLEVGLISDTDTVPTLFILAGPTTDPVTNEAI